MKMKLKLLGWGTAVLLLLTFLVTACTMAAPEPADRVEKEATAVPDAAAAPTQEVTAVNLPDMGAAPEFRNDVWLNSDRPVSLADQRGKVVLLAFWTFG